MASSPQRGEVQEGFCDPPEFEFNNRTSVNNYSYCAAFSPSSSAPADELFFEGHLLPLFRPPLPENSGYGDYSFHTPISISEINSSCSIASSMKKEHPTASRNEEASKSSPLSFMNWKCIVQKIKNAPSVSKLPRFSQQKKPRANQSILEWNRQRQRQKQNQKRRTFPVSPDRMTSGERSSSFPPTELRHQLGIDSRKPNNKPWYAKIFSSHASLNNAASSSRSPSSPTTAIAGSSAAAAATNGSKASFSSSFSSLSSSNSSSSSSSNSWEPKRPSISSAWDCNHISTRLVAVPSSCPVSTKSSPNNSGLLYCNSVMAKNPPFCHSSMQQELESAIQGAITYCKQSQNRPFNNNVNSNINSDNSNPPLPMDFLDQSARCSI